MKSFGTYSNIWMVNGRILILLCHNNDLADGWEREGENKEYYQKFSERWSYPMGINIVTYAMTH